MLHFRTLSKNDFCSFAFDLYSQKHVRTRKSIFSISCFFMSYRLPDPAPFSGDWLYGGNRRPPWVGRRRLPPAPARPSMRYEPFPFPAWAAMAQRLGFHHPRFVPYTRPPWRRLVRFATTAPITEYDSVRPGMQSNFRVGRRFGSPPPDRARRPPPRRQLNFNF